MVNTQPIGTETTIPWEAAQAEIMPLQYAPEASAVVQKLS